MIKLLRALALFAPLGLAVVAVNYVGDPAHLFSVGDAEGEMARALLGGRPIVASFRFDEMRLQQRLAQGRGHAPDVLVLGSSRSMPLSAAAFPGQTVVNASVSSASIEDVIALLEVYEGQGLRPRILFLPVEPWALNGSLRNPSVALEPELRAGLRRLGRNTGSEYGALPVASSLRRRWLKLVSPAYFQASLTLLLARGFTTGGPRAAGASTSGKRTEAPAPGHAHRRDPDGSLEWEPAMAERGPAEVEAMALASAAGAPAYLQAPPDRARLLLLRMFVDDVARRGTRVVFWLPPFHPAAYPMLVAGRAGRGVSEGEREVRALAAVARVPVVGSYGPGTSGVTGEDFVDYNHLRRASANALVGRLLAEAGIDLGR